MQPILFLNPLPWPVLVIAVLAILAALWLAWDESGRRNLPEKYRVGIAALRAGALLFLLVLICDPAKPRGRDAQNDWLGLVIDTSASMAALDGRESTRLQQTLEPLLQHPAWKQLAALYPVETYVFSDKIRSAKNPQKILPHSGPSRLYSALARLESRYADDPHLIGWILLSDGNATDRPEDTERVLKTLTRAVTVLETGSGAENVPNIALTGVDLEQDVFTGQRIPVKVSWQSSLEPGVETRLEIRLFDQVLFRQNVPLQPGEFTAEIPIDKEGKMPLEVELKPAELEIYTLDNQATAWVESHRRKIRVFYAESFYKDENVFKKALEEDRDFEVHFASSLVGFAKEKRVPFVLDPVYGLPADPERLAAYDVIILSDVKRALLKDDQMEWIREWVEKDGGALVMVGGLDSFGDGGYSRSPLEAMLPVEISEEYQKDVFLKARGTVDAPFRIEIAPGAGDHPILQFVQDAGENRKIWEQMPLLGGYNYVGRLKPGAQVLWQHPADKSRYGQRVILAVQSFGRGRVLAFTSDITPNWGEQFLNWKNSEQGWLYARFWRSALKWLSRNRVYSRAAPLSVTQKPLLATVEDEVRFQVNVPGSASGRGRYELFKNNERAGGETFDFLPGAQDPVIRLGHLEQGDYKLVLQAYPNGKPPVSSDYYFTVHASRLEADHLDPQPDSLKEIAQLSGGTFIPEGRFQELEQAVRKMQHRQMKQSAEPLWNKVWIYALILAMLFCEWLLRKKKGLEP